MNPRIKKVACIRKNILEVTFINDEVKLFDVTPYLSYPVFEELNDESFLKKVYVINGTAAWSDSIDFDPDTLYLEGQSIVPTN